MIKYRDKSGKINEIEGDLFVTKDKKGKDVFAGDKVNWKPEDIDELCQEEEELLEADVVGGFLVFDVEGTEFVEASKFKDIELIGEREDE